MIQACLVSSPPARPEADEVARAVFDSTRAEPIRMTSPGDVASGLTRRIRESAAADSLEVPQWQRELMAAPEPTPTRRWWQRRPGTKGATAPTRSARHASPGPVTAPAARGRRAAHVGHGRRGARGAPAVREAPLSPPRAIARDAAERSVSARVGLVVAVAIGLVLVGLVPWQLSSAGDARGGATHETTVAADGAEQAATGVRTDRSAPRTAPTQLARELTALREQMVRDLDTGVLERLDAPGSPAAEQDRKLIETLTASGSRYRGVDLAVRSAQLERAGGRVAVLRMTSDAAAYTVAGPEGEEQHPGSHGQQVELVLVWDTGAWRVREVR
ncbi:hypothetical protein [Janibacter sp. DB-40]|uniref:hypothetical protein n=1 Tax=Janibacter sp. DB-40 TaxID=3028808 RepID=UPI00240630CF|nr:hypothetical protein [Janibacter sp. DB-40]